MKIQWVLMIGAVILVNSGCQCCPMFDSYANVIDDVSDTHVYFDRFYNPRWDISRIGRPDWYSPWKNWWCPRCTQQGCYDRYDDCYLYPPLYPAQYAGHVMPPPTIRRTRIPTVADPDADYQQGVPPVPAPKPSPL